MRSRPTWIRLILLVALTVGVAGCAGSLDNAVGGATKSAAGALDDPATKLKLDDLASSVTASALGPDTEKRLQAITAEIMAQVKEQLTEQLTEILTVLQSKLTAILAELPAEIRPVVRAAVDEALGATTQSELDTTRETVVGKELTADLTAALVAATPLIANAMKVTIDTSVSEVKQEAAAEVAQFKWIAIGLGIAVVVLLVIHVHAVHVLKSVKS